MSRTYTKNPIVITGLQEDNYVVYSLDIVTKTGAKHQYIGYTRNIYSRRDWHWGQKDRDVFAYLSGAKSADMNILHGFDTEAEARLAEANLINGSTGTARKAAKVINKQHNQYTFI